MKEPTELSISLETGAVGAVVYPAETSGVARPLGALVLAHGAGAGQRSSFMIGFARGLAALGVDVVTFNFPYIEQGRRLPDRPHVLESCYRVVIERARRELAGAQGLFIGGKSMGGRIATQVAAADPDRRIEGLVLLGYPLHPPGRPTERRDAHLVSVRRPALFVQGSRDAFGTPDEVAPIAAAMAPPAVVHVVDGGDHSFKVPGRGDQTAVYRGVQLAIAEWIGGRLSASKPSGR